jgi:hypothetical protein
MVKGIRGESAFSPRDITPGGQGYRKMKISRTDLEQNTLAALEKCLQGIPFIKWDQAPVRNADDHEATVLRARVSLPDGEKWFLIYCNAVGQPRMARAAVNYLLRELKGHPDRYSIFAAPYISERAAQVCSSEGIGYLDFGGNCRLAFEKVYIEKQGNPNGFSEKRDLRSLYSPRSSRILRVLLCNPNRTWRMQTLADEAQVSVGLVSKVKRLLRDREWVREESQGLVLTEPEALLAEWSENYSYRKNQVNEFYSKRSIPEIESSISTVLDYAGINYALTGFSGAERLAPFVRYQRVMAYVERVDERLLSMLDVKAVDSGANLWMLIPYDNGVFFGSNEIRGNRVASPIQVYLDLLRYPGRGKEAATELFEQVIQSTWRTEKTT